MLAFESAFLPAQKNVENLQRLLELLDANARTFVGDAALVELFLHPARTDTEFESTTGQHVDSRRVLREHSRMTEAVGQHGGAETNLVGGHRERSESGDRADLITQVIRNHERVVAEFLGLLRELDEASRTTLFGVALATGRKPKFA